jgi:hypothetical protein
MPRRIHTIVSKDDSSEKIALNALSYEEALEEALDKLGWRMEARWDEPYESMYQDEHMMSLKSQELI